MFIEARVLKIHHGALIYLKGVSHYNIYCLQGRTVFGTAIVADNFSNATI